MDSTAPDCTGYGLNMYKYWIAWNTSKKANLHEDSRAWLQSLLVLALLGTANPVKPRELPLWEAGAGGFQGTFPAYRGSEDQQNFLLPFPYLIYRGTYLKIDRDGARLRLFDSDRVKLNLSASASLPAKSDDNNARKGMPDLDPTFEIGPQLKIRLAQISSRQTLNLRLPVRAVIATDFTSARHVGWIFNPNIRLYNTDVFGGWNIGLSLGPVFATGKYHEYFYEVKPKYETPERPAYRASGGYSGSAAIVTIRRRFNRIWLGGFVRYDYLDGAEFDDSPLVETRHSLMAGLGIVWIFASSSRTVGR